MLKQEVTISVQDKSENISEIIDMYETILNLEMTYKDYIQQAVHTCYHFYHILYIYIFLSFSFSLSGAPLTCPTEFILSPFIIG